jgi:hypothetical protein
MLMLRYEAKYVWNRLYGMKIEHEREKARTEE